MHHHFPRISFLGFFQQVILILLLSTAGYGRQQADTTQARLYYEEGVRLRKARSYDSAFQYWDMASRIYKSHEVWHDYLLVRYSLGYNLSLNGDHVEARKILLDAHVLGTEKLTEMSEAMAYVNYGLSWSYGADAKFYQAIEYQNKSIAARKQLFGDSSLALAKSYGNQGYNYKRLGKYDTARMFTEKAFQIRQKMLSSDHPDVATSLFEIAWLKSAEGFYRDALDLHLKALDSRQASLDPGDLKIATSLNNIGWCYVQLGDYEKALEYYEVALAMRIERYGRDHTAVATTYHNLGVLFSQKGNYDKAILYHLKGNQIFNEKKRADHQDNVQFYNFLGMAYMGKNDHQNALKYHLMALEIAEEIEGDHLYKSQTYAYLGKVSGVMGDLEKQGAYYRKAIPIEIALNGAEHRNVAKIYVNLAKYLGAIGERKSQLDYLAKALKIRTETFGENHYLVAQIHMAFGDYHQDMNQLDSALTSYDRALASLAGEEFERRSTSSLINAIPALQSKAEVLQLLAKNEARVDKLDLAIDTYREAVQVLDTIRYSFLSSEAQQDISGKFSGLFEGAIGLLYERYIQTDDQDYALQAFELMERNKAFSLGMAIRDAEAKQFSGMPDSLLQTERQLRIDIAFFESRLASSSARKDKARRESLISELFEARNKYQQLILELEENYPKYHELKYATNDADQATLTISQLNPKTAVLEYFDGDKDIYAIGLTGNQTSFVKVDRKEQIARDIRDFRRSISDYQFMLNQKEAADRLYLTTAYEIYETLVEPVVSSLGEVERIIVIPDGEINHINLEALIRTNVDTNTSPNYRELDYFVKKYQVSYSQSASILLNGSSADRSIRPTGQFVGFAPDYADAAFALRDTTKHVLAQLLVRDGNLPLPGAAFEVESIGALFDGKVMLKSDASESSFKAVARDYQILHLAMHSLLDDENPLNSELLFTSTNDSLNDGFLELSEIYNLDLNAEMVVLSACNTGYGKLRKGEGSINLSRAFRYAGSNSIVMSLWKVPDGATSEIMVGFYQQLLADQPKDRALQLAKLAFLKENDDPLLNHPYYWAGFIPMGEMDPIDKQGHGAWFWIIVLLGGGGLLLLVSRKFRD